MDMTECAADMSSYAIVFFTLKVKPSLRVPSGRRDFFFLFISLWGFLLYVRINVTRPTDLVGVGCFYTPSVNLRRVAFTFRLL